MASLSTCHLGLCLGWQILLNVLVLQMSVQEGGLHIDEHCWTLDKPMASLSTCHLGLCLGWQILLNVLVLQMSVFFMVKLDVKISLKMQFAVTCAFPNVIIINRRLIYPLSTV